MALKKANCLDCDETFHYMSELKCTKCMSVNVKKLFSGGFSSKEKNTAGQSARLHIEETKEMLKELRKEKWK